MAAAAAAGIAFPPWRRPMICDEEDVTQDEAIVFMADELRLGKRAPAFYAEAAERYTPQGVELAVIFMREDLFFNEHPESYRFLFREERRRHWIVSPNNTRPLVELFRESALDLYRRHFGGNRPGGGHLGRRTDDDNVPF
jgi:hypothetical protein